MQIGIKNDNETKFWSLDPKDVAFRLESDLDIGITDEEASIRLKEFGKNIIESGKITGPWKIFFNQFTSPLIVILIIAGLITLIISHYRDAVFIFIAVIVNSLLGFYQENKAERALSELGTYLKQRTRVIRGGKEKEIDSEDIVVGDVVRLSQGDRVPADARIFYENDFQVDESVLTGESLPVFKTVEKIHEDTVLADQTSMIFAGTLVTQGICTAVVCRADDHTEFGKIAGLIASTDNDKTPLQKAISAFGFNLSIFLGLLTVLVFFIGIFSGRPFLEMFLTSVAIAVSAIPEGLPVSLTVIFAVGVERMAKRKGVVRKLIAAEALGSTTLILTDKTGTLTMAKMLISQVIPINIEENKLMSYALTNTNVLIENPDEDPLSWRMNGKIMEMALVRSAVSKGFGVGEILEKKNVLQSLPFNAVHKFSISLVKEGTRHLLVFLGAPDILVSHSELQTEDREKLSKQIDGLAFSGERLLGVAVKEVNNVENLSLGQIDNFDGLSFGGLITFKDPVRPGMKDIIARVAQAGIRTVIVTGDHKGTAMAIAKEVGLPTDHDAVIEANELNQMSDVELTKILRHLSVVARVTPSDKLRIARLFQNIDEIVAMTGDGVNDAPSIKQANVGIAMGSGTEVARSVADLVLLDDNFETIVSAIEEGRQIFHNIRKVLVYLLSNVADGLILIGGSLLTGLPLPLNALQILWVNFFTDSFPSVAFAFEKDPDSLFHKPKRGQMHIFDPLMKFLILIIGLSTSLLIFILYALLLRLGYDPELVKTFTFASFGTYTLLVALSVRSLDKSILSVPFFSNKFLIGGLFFGFILMAAAVYLPILQLLFGTVSLPLTWVVGVLAVGILNIVLIEISKHFFKQKSRLKAR